MDRKIEIVHWVDSHSHDGWLEKDSIKLKSAECVSVGFVHAETDEILCLIGHTGEGEEVSAIMVIPKVCIQKRLKVPFKGKR